MAVVNWLKTNKLVFALSLIILFLLFRELSGGALRTRSVERSISPPSSGIATMEEPALGMLPSTKLGLPDSSQEAPPTTTDSERMVVKNSNLSLLVNDVKATGEKIIDRAKSAGGYMVEASYNRPNESPFATITVRIPENKLDETLNYFRSLAIKVTSERLLGKDVTDQYVDIEARIATLQKTKAKFEQILDKAVAVTEILQVQRELISIQSQIDSLVGQQKSLEQNANLSKVTAYLSTDELALPYTPDKAFRPQLVLKQAVRSLLGTMRSGANASIWVGVYSVIWVPLLVIIYIVRKRKTKKLPQES
ncbi:MAG: hypothetical protein UU05_C0055G0003 [Candidatus Curtissbacteria bacterium GW2011_GWA1_40_47]|uniref:DUF4349 domain-containing protein n=1 Tax=Candidatus Curtissbacteria bacterium RIFOXYA1_FULL_41_14 TaxID=1797737 RepID=A0A1F5HCP0_9BACT|nr:MAG: hypothetical protein UT95_C0022G0008 [Candidatus Curtissbacteria bacterium GW2011_GWB1_40_28]KKR59833.1 MAG: hypothetical protein UT99_C0023G0007 [Candidatus Curtissbacteria bacterium GW2011_GWA2_40_31]KKR61300.1 MAG: hypothetical protein UU00_C0017G0008 [Microgenomates group bacterium GW2011_GWC1_40_35]KKR64108.1 MAG: hypothetical protein UU05_C0055G0003 [Candidatus Curtissbacteria bacterium GW2011_GWA1_40_47]KKR77290.1 MAG: hypothetical protein UU19_C0014G0007 [Candidatus Curtissbacte